VCWLRARRPVHTSIDRHREPQSIHQTDERTNERHTRRVIFVLCGEGTVRPTVGVETSVTPLPSLSIMLCDGIFPPQYDIDRSIRSHRLGLACMLCSLAAVLESLPTEPRLGGHTSLTHLSPFSLQQCRWREVACCGTLASVTESLLYMPAGSVWVSVCLSVCLFPCISLSLSLSLSLSMCVSLRGVRFSWRKNEWTDGTVAAWCDALRACV